MRLICAAVCAQAVCCATLSIAVKQNSTNVSRFGNATKPEYIWSEKRFRDFYPESVLTGRIQVEWATYGSNCDGYKRWNDIDNAAFVSAFESCEGRELCNYIVHDMNLLPYASPSGDHPYPGCEMEFNVRYTCDPDKNEWTSRVCGADNMALIIDCASNPPTKGTNCPVPGSWEFDYPIGPLPVAQPFQRVIKPPSPSPNVFPPAGAIDWTGWPHDNSTRYNEDMDMPPLPDFRDPVVELAKQQQQKDKDEAAAQEDDAMGADADAVSGSGSGPGGAEEDPAAAAAGSSQYDNLPEPFWKNQPPHDRNATGEPCDDKMKSTQAQGENPFEPEMVFNEQQLGEPEPNVSSAKSDITRLEVTQLKHQYARMHAIQDLHSQQMISESAAATGVPKSHAKPAPSQLKRETSASNKQAPDAGAGPHTEHQAARCQHADEIAAMQGLLRRKRILYAKMAQRNEHVPEGFQPPSQETMKSLSSEIAMMSLEVQKMKADCKEDAMKNNSSEALKDLANRVGDRVPTSFKSLEAMGLTKEFICSQLCPDLGPHCVACAK